MRSRQIAEYKEDLKQNWIKGGHDNRYCYRDQFGFRIEPGTKYKLYWNNELVTKTYSMVAAQEISRILLNDKIMHVDP